jgi:hypothetical protein
MNRGAHIETLPALAYWEPSLSELKAEETAAERAQAQREFERDQVRQRRATAGYWTGGK